MAYSNVSGELLTFTGSQGIDSQDNGFVERYNITALDEFFREAFRKKFYSSVEELQKDLDEWLYHYNHERPHLGYRNKGRKPYETSTAGKKEIGKHKGKKNGEKEMKKSA